MSSIHAIVVDPEVPGRLAIEVEATFHDIGDVAQRLRQRQFTGKAVLHLA
ncbi:MAG TPA: hypothetical protein VF026_03920 [Ktedonobacteraceae bacterium]